MVIAGKEYGSGSSRDWAAKGTLLLGVKAVIAESFERIHRSNLVNMGVLPLQFPGPERTRIAEAHGPRELRHPRDGRVASALGEVTVRVTAGDGTTRDMTAIGPIDTPEELVAFRHGGHPALRAAAARERRRVASVPAALRHLSRRE